MNRMRAPDTRHIAATVVTTIVAMAVTACGRPPAPTGSVERVTVPPGAGLGVVAETLAARRVIGNRFWFKLVGRLKGVDRRIHAGVYDLPRGASTAGVLDALTKGRTASTRLTIPEGLTLPEVAAMVEARLGVPADSFLAAARDSTLIREFELAGPSVEGFLRPETYAVPVGSTARDVVRLLVQSFTAAWDPRWNARLDSLGMTLRELVTLASIVEGEARVDDERETIAGVYRNRLRIGMALQADPTVQYAILLATGRRKPRLYEKDYLIDSPYNTYRHPGLPPGPVNSPSRRSIEAALYPADVPYLYFVAGPDGRHIFSRTYTEHLRAIAMVRAAPLPRARGSAP